MMIVSSRSASHVLRSVFQALGAAMAAEITADNHDT